LVFILLKFLCSKYPLIGYLKTKFFGKNSENGLLRGYFETIIFYKDENKNKNFTGVKPGNDLYYRGVKPY